jgi:hypothetical protein
VNKLLIFIGLIFGSKTPLFSVTTSFWEVSDFRKCKLKNIMLSREGFALLSPKIEEIWENPETYIWTMVEANNTLYVGTGAEGKVYKIKGNKSSLLFDTKEASVFSLCFHNKKIYVGTAPKGKIFVINEKGEGKIFKDTDEEYIWEIVAYKGDLYVATGIKGRILKITKDGKVDTFFKAYCMNFTLLKYIKPYFYAGTGEDGMLFKINHQGKGFCIYDTPESEITGIVQIDNLLFFSAIKDTQSSLYIVHPDNSVEKIWQISAPIRGIQKYGNKIIAGAKNRIYRVDKEGDSELLVELPASISCLTSNWIGTSEIGKIYNLSSRTSKKGSIESPSYDTKTISRWGKLKFEGDYKIKFKTRTGNTEKPDQTWEEWREVDSHYKIMSQSARFIQWEATLLDPKSKLKKVRIPFLPQNVPPKVLNIKTIFLTKPEKSHKKGDIKIIWRAQDLNKDSLEFNLYFKFIEEEMWTQLNKETFRDTFYYIDPKSFPDGEYHFRVEVFDSPSNPPDDVLKSERISGTVIIDNTLPEIQIVNVKNKKLEFKVKDNRGIKLCKYALDGGKWRSIFPKDKLFDSKIEEFKLHIGNAKKVVIRAYDIYGNATLKSKLIK